MILYGAGGHAKAVADCLIEQSVPVCGLFDDNPGLLSYFGGILKDLPVLGTYSPEILPDETLLVSIGDNQLRKDLSLRVSHSFGLVCHSSAIISRFSSIGFGTVCMPLSVLQAEASVGRHCIVNTAAVIEHECSVGDFVHLGPRAVLCGRVSVGEGAFVGAGAVVLPNVRIGKWAVVGAGAVVVADIPDYTTAVGIPAKVIRANAEYEYE